MKKAEQELTRKKFNLRTKGAKKALAMLLAVSMVVPAIPGQKVNADVDYWRDDIPEAVANYPLDSADEFIAEGTTGTAIKFTGEAVKATLTGADGKEYQSTDKTPVMDGDKYVMEDIDVTPEVVVDDERGCVLSLKDSVNVPQYPAGATSEDDIKQEAAKYNSAVKVANPFTALRDKLYDDSKYTFDKIYATGTEVTRYEITNNTDRFADYKNRYSAPVAETGVTVSFWASLPVDEEGKAAVTNLVEFYNDETVIYKTDDLAKNWIAQQYAAAEAAGTANDTDSPFYIGTVKEATIKALGASITENFGETFKAGEIVNYIADDYGIYAKWNPEIADAAYATKSGALKCWTIKSISNISQGDWAAQPLSKKYIVVDLGNGDYAQLQWSDTVYAEGDENAKLNQFASTEEAPYGTFTQYTEGSTGVLNLASNQQFYHRDLNKTGIQQNENNSNVGSAQSMENNTYAYVYADGSVKGSLMNVVENGEEAWHYVTYTITNEWIQTYVDGVAVDPAKVTTWYGNTFNQGSGIYKPNSTYVTGGNMRSDWQKISNDDFNGSIYGQLFGTTVMDFITDENTELYIGGKTQVTVEGTLIDSVLFYDEAFSRNQVAAEYTERNITNPDKYKGKVVIRFDTKGGNELEDIEVTNGEIKNLPVPEREGYKFQGWYMDNDCTEKFEEGMVPEKLLTILYAKWENDGYVVYFDTMGGKEIEKLKFSENETIKNLPVPKRDGYKFQGWYMDSACTEKFVEGTVPENRVITLYAKWKDLLGNYVLLSDLEEMKAGETAVVNVVVNRDMYLNAFDFRIEINSDIVKMTTQRDEYGEYRFFAKDFNYSGGTAICNYVEDDNEIILVGANAEIRSDGAYVKAGTVIARFEIQALEDLTKGAVVATETTKMLTDEVLDATTAEGQTEDCVVYEKGGLTPYISVNAIKEMTTGETARIELKTNRDVYMNEFEFDITLGDNLTLKSNLENEKIAVSYTEEFNKLYVGGSCVADIREDKITLSGTNEKETLIAAGTVIAYIEVQAEDNLMPGKIAATVATKYITDYVNDVELGVGQRVSSIVQELKRVSLTFETGCDVKTNSKELKEGDKAGTLPTLERKGYTFEGWYLDEAFTQKLTEETIISGDTTAYAKWNAIDVVLNFVTNNGMEVEARTMKADTEVGSLPELEKEGYEFQGWYADKELTIRIKETTRLYEDTTVYAKWEALKVVILFADDDGKVIDLKEYKADARVDQLPKPEKEGHTFEGWYFDKDYTQEFAVGGKVYKTGIVYAKWKNVDEIIEITDEQLLAVLIAAGVDKDDNLTITKREMEQLTSLTIDGKQNAFTDLSSLGYAKNLVLLEVVNSNLSDVSWIPKLENLKYLYLANNKIEDVKSLEKMKNLEILDLGCNQITDISELGKITSLKKLYLHTNQITDLTGLETLTNLVWLDISNNTIEDITPLLTMEKLSYLYISDNKIKNIEELYALPSLELLVTEDNKIGEEELMMGDADGDGDVDANDALLVLKCVAKMVSMDELPENQLKQADVDGKDGILNANDALLILKFVAKMVEEL